MNKTARARFKGLIDEIMMLPYVTDGLVSCGVLELSRIVASSQLTSRVREGRLLLTTYINYYANVMRSQQCQNHNLLLISSTILSVKLCNDP